MDAKVHHLRPSATYLPSFPKLSRAYVDRPPENVGNGAPGRIDKLDPPYKNRTTPI